LVTALLELRDAIEDGGHLYLFSILVALIWTVWLVKVVLSRRYAPWTDEYRTTSSVVIPVVDEPVDLFRDVLTRIVRQNPTEVLVVINGPRNPDLEAVCAEFPLVQWEWTPVAGKRNALRVGILRISGEVAVLVDSDTLWTDGTLDELRKPFADPRVGGVTTRQRILSPDRNFVTRWADWLESSRSLYSMPAQSVLGHVGCLPGRTIAFRRDVLERIMPDFLTQKFLGVVLEVSDDRTLTNLTLKLGFRTVYQSTSLVYTDCPTRLKKMAKQQYRWARGSQYNTLRMLPWMLAHAPVLAFFFVVDILIPFLWVCSAIGWTTRSTTGGYRGDLYGGILSGHRPFELPAMLGLVLLSSWVSMSLRQRRHLEQVPGDVFLMPPFVVFSTLFLMPIRLYGFARLAKPAGWGTRANAYAGGETGHTVSGRDTTGASGEMLDASPLNATPLDAAPLFDAGATTLTASPVAATVRPRARSARRFNPYELVPLILFVLVLAGGVLYDTWP
jgi:hyaluronan synthase